MKQKLTLDEQIAHLQRKGVGFALMDAQAARVYLRRENNYFRLAAYRKNFQRHPGGANAGQYVRLEFAYLADLATIDRLLRDLVLGMALDIEHAAKMQIMCLVDDANDEDGYSIVQDFIAGLDDKERRILDGEIARNRHNTYCGDMVRKYDGRFPVWVFLEVISFGKLCSFYRFVADRFNNQTMVKTYYRLRMCQILRNAAAHGSCILNDLNGSKTQIKTDTVLNQALAQIPGMSKTFRVTKMRNERVQQLTTLLYTYQTMVERETDSRQLIQQKLCAFVKRLQENSAYYQENDLIRSTFAFLLLVIDSWYDIR